MSYLRLDPNFFEKHSTLELEELIGEKAFWVPLRLRAYAFRCQDDGDFSKFTESQRQKVLGIVNVHHLRAAWEAMHKVGILKGDQIVGWAESMASADRRRAASLKANAVRWGTGVEPKPPPENEDAPPAVSHINTRPRDTERKDTSDGASASKTPFPSPVKDSGGLATAGVAPGYPAGEGFSGGGPGGTRSAGQGTAKGADFDHQTSPNGQELFKIPVFEPLRAGMFPSTAQRQRAALEEDLARLTDDPKALRMVLTKEATGIVADLRKKQDGANLSKSIEIQNRIDELLNPAKRPEAYTKQLRTDAKALADALKARIKSLKNIEKGIRP